jgi:hypothetical protein
MEKEDNRQLMEEVSKAELKEVLHSFQKDKIPGHDGWPIEFFLRFYEFLDQDILKVVKDTRLLGRLPISFNSNFIALIPKLDNPSSLDDFIPISLCNCLHKIVAKVITRRVKVILSKRISSE